ncbi:MAG TPA: hypothetical protein VES67_12440 [Vicinamibacterales bacterium]|nr:hypothetical protein [Vicinamibacterales bacterium]
MFRNSPLFFARTPGQQVTHSLSERLDVFGIELLTPLGGSLASELSRVGIREALLLRSHERRVLDEHTLPLVPLARPAETDDDRSKGRMAAGSPRECGITPSQEHEMIEIGTREAQRSFRFQSQEPPFA